MVLLKDGNQFKKMDILEIKKVNFKSPIIMFKRDSVEKRRDLGNKMDGNNPKSLHYTFQEKYSKRNQYDNFSILHNRTPQKEFHNVVVPDFVK
jgi:bifunctional DNA-binding transcriptional regulator/antitoxin component of YhaV-PrlF toxin-antitoxin module